MNATYLLDSCAWFEYFRGTAKGEKMRTMIEEGQTATSVIGIAELSDKYERIGMQFEPLFGFMQHKTRIIPLTMSAALTAGKLKRAARVHRPKFSLADGLHLATAIENDLTLVTTDSDFNRARNVLIIT
jgi:predicted nucleic acid-binding protein